MLLFQIESCLFTVKVCAFCLSPIGDHTAVLAGDRSCTAAFRPYPRLHQSHAAWLAKRTVLVFEGTMSVALSCQDGTQQLALSCVQQVRHTISSSNTHAMLLISFDGGMQVKYNEDVQTLCLKFLRQLMPQ